MCDVDKAIRLKHQAFYYALYGCQMLLGLTDEQLAAGYNGIGPEWFPKFMRRAIDALHPDLEVIAFIHDEMWSYGEGTRSFFELSNDYLEMNGVLVADAKYRWYDPRRYIRRRQARLFADLCRDFGWMAFKAANEKAKEA